MRPIQNNLANLQINQIAMEQAALQSAKSQQATRARAETAEEILRQEKNDPNPKIASSTDPNGKKNSNPQKFKNAHYSKEGTTQTNSDVPTDGAPVIPKISRIDFKA
jgi:hypothetical protein